MSPTLLLLGHARASGQDAWIRVLADGETQAHAAVAKLDREFAVAVCSPDGRQAFFAVDRFAIHTLCYRIDGDRIHIASRADEAAGPVGEIDAQAIFDYLYFHCIPAPRTVFRGVFRLPPGHAAWFENGRLNVRPYWVPTFQEPAPARTFEALRDDFRRRVQDAVAARLADGTPACYLSGGTDSSTVAGMIGRVAGEPAHTYSIGFDAAGYDEMAFARVAAKHFGTRHREYYVTPDDLVAGIPTVAASYDQPFGNSSALPAYYCAKVAREDGVTRMLAGDGGDELFGGNSRYAVQRVFGWYQNVPGAIRRGLLEPLLDSPLGAVQPLRKARGYVEQARQPMPDRLQRYNLLVRLGLDDVLEPAFRERLDEGAPLALQREVWAQARTGDDLHRTLAFDWRFTLADSDLPKVCGTAQLAGMEVAFPFLDDGLLDFSMSLPVDYKLRGLKLRWFFKEALRGFLPDEILTKKKQGFGLPFGVWTTRHRPLRELAEESLRSVAERGIVRPAFVDALLTRHLPAHPGYYGEMVWILMMLEQWLRAHAPNASLGR